MASSQPSSGSLPPRPPSSGSTVLAHHSNLFLSAHSRLGFYPQDEVAEVRRRRAPEYKENRDQPQHGRYEVLEEDEPIQERSYSPPRTRSPPPPPPQQRRTPRPPPAEADEPRARARRMIDEFQLTRLFPGLRKRASGPAELPAGVTLVDTKSRTSASASASRAQSASSGPRTARAASAHRTHVNPHAYLSFDPTSPISNFHALRVQHAVAAAQAQQRRDESKEEDESDVEDTDDTEDYSSTNGLMSSLSPRTHRRAAQQHPHYPNAYHPSAAGRPGTSPLLASYPHSRPFMPCNPAEARRVFRGSDPAPPDCPADTYQPARPVFRAPFSPTATSGRKVKAPSAGGGGGSLSARPFVCSSSSRRAAAATVISYTLNSPDETVSRLERTWTRQQAHANRKRFVEDLKSKQGKERALAMERGRREGRIIITDALPPRPLALDPWADSNRQRYLGK